MKDLKDKIDVVGKQVFELRNEIISSLIEFIKKYGKEVKGKMTLAVDSEVLNYLDFPSLLSSENRMGDTYCYAEICSIYIGKYGDEETIWFETEYDTIVANWTDIYELIAIYEAFKMFEHGDFNENLEVVDGTMKIKWEE